MPWFMVDDKLHSHKKRLRAGIEAMGLWCIAGSWCADQLTDGFIPDYAALALDAKAEKRAAALVAAGFWVETTQDGERGWQFHEWTEMQPTREEVEAKRAEARERMRRVRENRRGGSRELRANEERSSQQVRLTPAQPSPSHPIRSSVGSSSGGGSPSVTPEARPPRRCPKHLNDPDPPNCGQCADARKAADKWQPPTLSAKTTMCGTHPQHPALNCPGCAEDIKTSPEQLERIRAGLKSRERKAS